MKLNITKDDWDVIREYLGKRPNIRQRMHWNAAHTNHIVAVKQAEFTVKVALTRISSNSKGSEHGNA